MNAERPHHLEETAVGLCLHEAHVGIAVTVLEIGNQPLTKNNITKEEIDYFVFHQANKFMLNTIRKVCVLPKDKFYVNLTETGNTVSSTVLIGLKDCINNKSITAGMKVMISGFGVGLSWGGTILHF
jgi:3-oxoacyl-[acyl-carrier-protein] synthase-3